MKKAGQGNISLRAPMGETVVLLHTCCAPCSSAIIEAMMKSGITPVIYYCNPNIYPKAEYEIRKEECSRYARSLGLEIVDADYDHENWLAQMKGLENEPERGGRCLKCFKLRLFRTAMYASRRGIRVIATTLASSRWKSIEQINEAGRWACEQMANRLGVESFPVMEPPVCVESPGCFSTAPLASARCPEEIEAATVPVPSDSERSVCPFGAVDYNRLGVESFPVMEPPVWWDHNWKKGGLQERRLQIIKEYGFYNQQYCGCEFSMRHLE